MNEYAAKRAGTAIDWKKLKASLETGDVGDYSEAELEAIFAQRADALAQANQQQEHKKAATHLGCRLGNVSLLLPLQYVMRILTPERVARVPGAPPMLEHILQVDGRIVAIADLRSALDIERDAQEPRRMVVLLGERTHRLALLVHAVRELVFLDEGSVSPASGAAGMGAEFVLGLSPELALVLDAQRLIHGLKAQVGAQS